MNLEFNRNEDVMKQSLSEMRQRLEKIYEGGGKKAIEKQKEKNKLTARERIDYLWIMINHLSRSALLPVMKCMKNRAAALPAVPLRVLDM